MKGTRQTLEEIVAVLRQTEAGTPVAEPCRQSGIAEGTFYRWKKQLGSLGVSELQGLRQLQGDNRSLRQLVAA